MIDRLPGVEVDLVEWKFQVEQQGFITRYGIAGASYFKQVILQSGQAVPVYPIKLIDRRVYETAFRLSQSLK